MFILPRAHLPERSDDLAAALEEGLRQFVTRPEKIVTLSGENVRELDQLKIDLSGGSMRAVQPPMRLGSQAADAGIAVCDFAMTAKPVSLWGADAELELQAKDAEFNGSPLARGQYLLVLHRAASGDFRAEMTRDALERLIEKAAAKVAQKQGVTIENVTVELEQPGRRSIAAKVTVAARKLLFRPVLHLSGTAALSESLVAKLSNLRCQGEGPIAALACAAITPHFAKLEQRSFPLTALPIGQVQLNDVSFDLSGGRILVTGTFGTARSRG